MLTQERRPQAPLHPASLPKPFFRGWLHAAAAVASAVFTLALLRRGAGHWPYALAVGVFGLCATEMYAVSALFHLGRWHAPAWRVLRTLDHASIFIAIAGTYTPFAVLVLGGWQRPALLATVWLLALAGVGLKVWLPYMSRGLSTSLYLVLGWIAALGLPAIASALPGQALILLVLGGLLYTLGAVVYAWRRPDPLPRVFGYHEVFHALVVAGNLAFALVILRWLPR
jgi:hemolysin III